MAQRVTSISTTKRPPAATVRGNGAAAAGGYELPVLHTRIPDTAVNVGFWGGLIGAVALGVVDLPLAALVGVGVLVARHRGTR